MKIDNWTLIYNDGSEVEVRELIHDRDGNEFVVIGLTRGRLKPKIYAHKLGNAFPQEYYPEIFMDVQFVSINK